VISSKDREVSRSDFFANFIADFPEKDDGGRPGLYAYGQISE